MAEINYDYEDFSSFVVCDEIFKKRFNVIANVKNGQTKSSFIVYDNEINKICFLKAKLINHYCNNDLEVYKVLKSNPHNNIEKIYDVIMTNKFYFVTTEYLNGLNLSQYKDKVLDISKKKIIELIDQVLSGLNHIHKLKIIHGDIKPDNILIQDDTFKIIDFDLSQISENNYVLANQLFGTENYLAPESFDLCIYSKKTDLWALGILLYKLITNKFPYQGKLNKICHFYSKNNFKNLDLSELNKYKNSLGANIILIISQLLSFKDFERPSIETIKFSNHELFKSRTYK